MTDTRLETGSPAPDFSLPDQDERRHALSDYAGQRVILYFYPAAMTPGCTKEACDFRDNLGELGEAGYAVLGVSKDSPAKLREFRDRDALTFPLLSDPGLEVHRAYGAYGEKSLYGKLTQGVIRSTFVIDAEGRIEQALYNVKATGHVGMLRRKLGLTV